MRNDLSAALLSAFTAPVQQPSFLLEIGFSSVIRVSSNATVSFGGYSWQTAGFDLSNIRFDGSKVTGSIKLPNIDNVYGALVLNEGVSDRTIRVWGYDAAATASADFVQLVDAVGGAATVDNDFVVISIRDPKEFVYSPRQRVDRAAGFTYLLPAGALITINGTAYTISRN